MRASGRNRPTRRGLTPVLALVCSACTLAGAPSGDSPAPPSSPADRPERGTLKAAPGLLISPVPSPLPASPPSLDRPEEVAQELIRAEREIRSPSTPLEAYPLLGRIQQAAYRKLVANPEWRPLALRRAPEELRPVLLANIRAGEQLSSLTKPVPKLPAWKIIPPPPPEELRRLYADAEAEYGIPWQYLAAIHLVETRMGRIRGTSTAGAQGPMQFIPSTWARYGRGDINNPRDAIMAAARYLKAAGAPDEMDRALYAYNHSQKYVDAVTAYAEQMRENERVYLAFHGWQVYVKTTSGDVLLEVGYG